MPFTLTMPKLSPTMEEGTIVSWHKKPGEHIESGEVLLEIATDKATVEHQALDSGWLRQVLVAEGGEAVVNQPIAIFTEEKDESITGYTPEGASPKGAIPPTNITQPQQPSLVSISTEEQLPIAPTIAPEIQKTFPEAIESENRILASPLAKKLAAQQSLDLTGLKGSGPGGRIMKRDLAGASQVHPKPSIEPKVAMGSFTEEALTPIRKVIAQRLQEAKATIPHFYLQQTIDAAPLVILREQLKKSGIKLTYNDLIIKASALTLKKHPAVNSGFASKGGSIIRFKTIDISVAVSIEGGLVTPIIRYADDKNVRDISLEVKALAKKAKEGKLQPIEFQGGSFTISNLGMYNVTNFFAIINPPQAAILAVSGISDVPVIKNQQVVPGQTMNLCLSVDHRVIDGVAAASFMQDLQSILENPAVLLF